MGRKERLCRLRISRRWLFLTGNLWRVEVVATLDASADALPRGRLPLLQPTAPDIVRVLTGLTLEVSRTHRATVLTEREALSRWGSAALRC